VTDYRVALDSFHGPLDLLLHLVKRHEVDILDISITTLAEQFLDFLAVMTELDVELAGEFLVVAATLLEIKARSLLPADVEPESAKDEPDPRRELVKQLLDYRRFKDAAAALEKQAEKHAVKLARIPIEEPSESRLPGMKPVELWDLVSAFARILRETRTATTTLIQADETPQHVHEDRIAAAVVNAGRLAFRDLFDPPYSRARLIGLFLAVLELVKQGRIRLEQPEPFGELYLCA